MVATSSPNPRSTNRSFRVSLYPTDDPVKICYVDEGADRALVFVHSGTLDHNIWEHQIEFFSRNYRCIAIDLPGGCGQSSCPDRPYTLEYYTAAVLAVMNHAKLTKAVIVGCCIGASIAVTLSKQHPDRVEGLIVMNLCGGVPMVQKANPYGLRRSGKPWPRWCNRVLRFLETVFKRTRRRLLRTYLFGTGTKDEDPVFQYVLSKPYNPAWMHNLTRGLSTFSTFSTNPPHQSETATSLLIWGKFNRVLRIQEGRAFAQACKPHAYQEFDAGHLLMVERADELNRAIEGFLGGLSVKTE